jgi:MFS family permease
MWTQAAQKGLMPQRTRAGRNGVRSLVAADVVSLTGNRISLLAIPWFVLETTGSATRTGLVAFFAFLPLAGAAFVGGHVVDRFGGRRTSVASDLASAGTTLLVPVLHYMGLLSFPLLLLLVFAGTALDGPGATGRRALVPDAASASGWRLEVVTSAMEGAFRSTQMIGGAAAAALIATVGAPAALLVNSSTFVVSACLIGFGARGLGGAPEPPPPLRASLAEGLRFLRNDDVLRAIVLLFVFANMLENALIAVLLPTYAQRTSGEALTLGLPVAALGAGALLGAGLYGRYGARLRLDVTVAFGLLLSGPPKYLVLSFEPSLAVVVGVFFVSSLAAGPLNPMLAGLQLRRIPAPLRGRVLGATMSAVVASIPLAVLVAGALADAAPVTLVLLVGAALYTALGLAPLISGVFRDVR